MSERERDKKDFCILRNQKCEEAKRNGRLCEDTCCVLLCVVFALFLFCVCVCVCDVRKGDERFFVF